MKAATALGLLAGLGAMNAMSGKPYGGKRFTGLLDMLDGGGAGQSGDKFEGGGLLSMLGNLFMKPLEAQKNVERIAADAAATRAVTNVLEQAAKDQRNLDNVDAYNAAQADAGAQAALMSDIYDDTILPAGSGGLRNRSQPSVLSGGTVQPMPSSSQDSDTGTAILTFGGGEVMPQPSIISPDSFSANPPSAAAMTPPVPAPEDRNSRLAAFNRRMESVPEFYRGTEIENMYRDHLLRGGLSYFDQFIRGSMATQDQGLLRTAPTMTAPAAPTVPTMGFN